jgi:hypothetical protein
MTHSSIIARLPRIVFFCVMLFVFSRATLTPDLVFAQNAPERPAGAEPQTTVQPKVIFGTVQSIDNNKLSVGVPETFTVVDNSVTPRLI